MGAATTATQLLTDIRNDLEEAATRILSLTCIGLEIINRPTAEPLALEPVFTGLLEACSFQDMTGQRLSQLEALLCERIDDRADSHLLNGPTQGALDQAEADRLLAAPNA